MGKQTNIKLRGTVGNTIYYQWKGIHCTRTVPARVRQTGNTRKAASLFGVAVKSAATVRSLVKPLLPAVTDRAVIYALDGAFRKWLHTSPLESTAPADDLDPFEEFSFNPAARLGKLYSIVEASRTNSSDVLISLPAFNPLQDVTAPRGTQRLGVEVMAVTLPFSSTEQANCAGAKIMIPYTDAEVPAQQIQIAGVTGLKSLVLITMTVRYYKSENSTVPINQVRWKPLSIVGSFYN